MGEKIGLRRAVLDTNVIVSALIFHGETARLAGMWQTGRFQLLATRDIIREYLRVLAYPKFRLRETEIIDLIHEEVLPFVVPVRARRLGPIIKEDPSDDRFLECAVAGKADMIISGDKHLLRLGNSREIQILSVSAFLQKFLTD